MPILGLNADAEPRGTAGLLAKGTARPGAAARPKVRPWTIFSHQHLALGLLPARSVTLNSAELRLLQTQLAGLGYYEGPIDGLYGPVTRAAHARYRQSLLQRVAIGPVSPLAVAAVRVAEGEAKAGVKESGGPNRGARIEEYQRTVGSQFVGQSWCACFVCWCLQQAAKSVGAVSFQLPKEAAAFRFEDWALAERAGGVCLLDPDGVALKRGDIVIFEFSHIGICTADAPAGSDAIRTVEGNTSAGRAASLAAERNGDGVYARDRDRSLVRSIVRVGAVLIDTAYPPDTRLA